MSEMVSTFAPHAFVDIHILPRVMTMIVMSLGNFHALLLFRNESEMEPIREAVYRLVRRAIALDGTCK